MRTLSLLMALSLGGCMLLPFESWQEAPRAPQPGDLVRVETRAGAKHVFRVYQTGEHAFRGVGRDGFKYRIPYAALKSLEVRETEYDWVALPTGAVGAATTGIILLGQ